MVKYVLIKMGTKKNMFYWPCHLLNKGEEKRRSSFYHKLCTKAGTPASNYGTINPVHIYIYMKLRRHVSFCVSKSRWCSLVSVKTVFFSVVAIRSYSHYLTIVGDILAEQVGMFDVTIEVCGRHLCWFWSSLWPWLLQSSTNAVRYVLLTER